MICVFSIDGEMVAMFVPMVGHPKTKLRLWYAALMGDPGCSPFMNPEIN